VNFAFVVVVIAAVSGLVSNLLLRPIAPDSGPALALGMMAVALLGAAWTRGRKPSSKRSSDRMRGSNESISPA
jgi:hypothetical protein